MAHEENTRRLRHHLLLMVLVGLALRLALILWFTTYNFGTSNLGPNAPSQFNVGYVRAPRDFNFRFGYETGAIAYSLTTGHGFSSPFGGSTGPTAWVAPLYPALCALVFILFGPFTFASGFVILLINSVFSALTCIPICRIGELTVGRKVGIWSAWIWAAGVLFMRWPTTWVWDMSASALLLGILFLQSLQLGQEAPRKRWGVFGLTWGIATLTNPALLAFLPAAGIYPILQLRRRQKSWLRNAAISALLFAVVVSPWVIRNRIKLGAWVFVRDNAGFEFSLGNYHGSNGMGWFGKHPTQNKWEYADYQRLREIAYIADRKQRALAFVRQYPREFAALCAARAAGFWTGTALEYVEAPLEPWQPWSYWLLSVLMLGGLVAAAVGRLDGVGLYFWLMLCYPITYALIFIHARYRHPIEPEMLLLGTYFVYSALQELAKRFALKQRSPAELQPGLIAD